MDETGKKILLAYVTRHGSTREMAERIGQEMRRSGLNVDISPADGAGQAASYDAVILGSAVYFGLWRRKTVAFLRAWRKLSSPPPLWLFFSGPTGDGDPKAQAMNGQGIPQNRIQDIEDIRPRDIAYFHGKIDAARLNGLEKWATRNVNAPLGDFRDWNAIDAWAGKVADSIRRGA
jgi:menaquinone-dependent protoporphyrinogen oxidase